MPRPAPRTPPQPRPTPQVRTRPLPKSAQPRQVPFSSLHPGQFFRSADVIYRKVGPHRGRAVEPAGPAARFEPVDSVERVAKPQPIEMRSGSGLRLLDSQVGPRQARLILRWQGHRIRYRMDPTGEITWVVDGRSELTPDDLAIIDKIQWEVQSIHQQLGPRKQA